MRPYSSNNFFLIPALLTDPCAMKGNNHPWDGSAQTYYACVAVNANRLFMFEQPVYIVCAAKLFDQGNVTRIGGGDTVIEGKVEDIGIYTVVH